MGAGICPLLWIGANVKERRYFAGKVWMTREQSQEVERLRQTLRRLGSEADGGEVRQTLGALHELAEDMGDPQLRAEHRQWQTRLVPFADAT